MLPAGVVLLKLVEALKEVKENRQWLLNRIEADRQAQFDRYKLFFGEEKARTHRIVGMETLKEKT